MFVCFCSSSEGSLFSKFAHIANFNRYNSMVTSFSWNFMEQYKKALAISFVISSLFHVFHPLFRIWNLFSPMLFILNIFVRFILSSPAFVYPTKLSLYLILDLLSINVELFNFNIVYAVTLCCVNLRDRVTSSDVQNSLQDFKALVNVKKKNQKI